MKKDGLVGSSMLASKINRWILCLGVCCSILSIRSFALEKLHFVTTTDTEHYTWTVNLVASIHRFHSNIGEIAVYDIGLIPEERAYLESLAYVQVYNVERTNPFIFEKFTVNNKGKISRGWYSWKPVVIKQAMERYSEFFYLDSGITVVGPMDLLFKQVHESGYFFIDCGHSIRRMTTKPVIKKFKLSDPANHWVMEKKGISSGIQGLSRALYHSYALPLYALTKDIANFADDGSCPKGFGWARHDQTVFSIQARLLNMQIYEVIRGGKLKLQDNGRYIKANLSDFIEITRADFDSNRSQFYLRYKSELKY